MDYAPVSVQLSGLDGFLFLAAIKWCGEMVFLLPQRETPQYREIFVGEKTDTEFCLTSEPGHKYTNCLYLAALFNTC